MNKKIINYLTTRLIFVIAVISVSIITPGIIALIVPMITQNVNYIVISSLAGTWISVVLILILISKFLYKRRIKSVEIDTYEKVAETKREFIRLYSIYILYFSLIIGYIFFELYDKIINELNGTYSSDESIDNSPIFYIRISFVVLLIVSIVIKKIRKRSRHLKTINPDNKKDMLSVK